MAAREPEALAALAGLWAEGRMRVCAERRHEKEQEYCTVTQDRLARAPGGPAATGGARISLGGPEPCPGPGCARLWARRGPGPEPAGGLGLVRIGRPRSSTSPRPAHLGRTKPRAGRARMTAETGRPGRTDPAMAAPAGRPAAHGVTGAARPCFTCAAERPWKRAGRAAAGAGGRLACACTARPRRTSGARGAPAPGIQSPARRERPSPKSRRRRAPGGGRHALARGSCPGATWVIVLVEVQARRSSRRSACLSGQVVAPLWPRAPGHCWCSARPRPT
jgi:primosomal protein N' (replication factor Y)